MVAFAYAVALYDYVGTVETRASFAGGARCHLTGFLGSRTNHLKGQRAFAVRQYSKGTDTGTPCGEAVTLGVGAYLTVFENVP
tara:strand:- start:260 stop:508 length:249 start_codon:yes stop_codon:yes gene_type:complete